VRGGVQSQYLASPRDRVIILKHAATKKQTEGERACVGGLFASSSVLAVCLQAKQSAERCCIIYYTQTLCVCDSVGISPLLRILCCCALGRMDCNEGISVLHIKGSFFP
jgi:hypothetical protein